MHFPFYIARRYLFSKKSHNAINIISAISVAGVAVASMALVVVLSVFNGFHDMVASFFTAFDAQLRVEPAQGKTARADDARLLRIKALPGIDVATECLEDKALAIYGDRQAMVTVKGVDDNFAQLTHITGILYGDGQFELHAGPLEYGVPGVRLAADLGLGARFDGFLTLYAPQREGQPDLADPESCFVADSLMSPGVVFAVGQSKYDKQHLLTSLAFARSLFGRDGELTSLELRVKPGADIQAVKREAQRLAGTAFRVLDRYEQQADTFKIMQIEKMMAFVFLTFILLVASFNIIGSLSMLIIEKRDDVRTLRSLGATDRQLRTIFLCEGRLIAVGGAVAGILAGLLLCFLQQQFGLVSLGDGTQNFIINAYPVSVHYTDVLLVFLTVLAIGWLAVWWPVSRHHMRGAD